MSPQWYKEWATATSKTLKVVEKPVPRAARDSRSSKDGSNQSRRTGCGPSHTKGAGAGASAVTLEAERDNAVTVDHMHVLRVDPYWWLSSQVTCSITRSVYRMVVYISFEGTWQKNVRLCQSEDLDCTRNHNVNVEMVSPFFFFCGF